MNTVTRLTAALALALAASSSTTREAAAQAASPSYNGPVAVVVSIPIPAGLSRAQIEALFEKSAPAYEALSGLKQKYFTVNDTRAGGIYLWVNRAAAASYFTEAWKAGVRKTYGAPAELTFFDAPLIIHGKAGMSQTSPARRKSASADAGERHLANGEKAGDRRAGRS